MTSLQSLRKCEVCYEAMSFVLATDKNEPPLETNTLTYDTVWKLQYIRSQSINICICIFGQDTVLGCSQRLALRLRRSAQLFLRYGGDVTDRGIQLTSFGPKM